MAGAIGESRRHIAGCPPPGSACITARTHARRRRHSARSRTAFVRSQSKAAQGLGGYVRHRPEESLLYEIARRHLEPFLALARERSGRALPRYVEEEFRAYLRCGVL